MKWGYKNVEWCWGGVSGWKGAGRYAAISSRGWLDTLIADGGVVLDTRSPAEFAAGHLTGARNVSVEDLAADPAGSLADLPLGTNTLLVLHGAGPAEASLYRAARALMEAGYGRVNVFTPGYAGE